MSHVTNVMITGLLEAEEIARLNQLVREAFAQEGEPQRTGAPFVDVAGFADGSPEPQTAGSKHMETSVLLGAFNYLPDGLFGRLLRFVRWDSPESVQLFIKSQAQDQFHPVVWQWAPCEFGGTFCERLPTGPVVAYEDGTQKPFRFLLCQACGDALAEHREHKGVIFRNVCNEIPATKK